MMIMTMIEMNLNRISSRRRMSPVLYNCLSQPCAQSLPRRGICGMNKSGAAPTHLPIYAAIMQCIAEPCSQCTYMLAVMNSALKFTQSVQHSGQCVKCAIGCVQSCRLSNVCHLPGEVRTLLMNIRSFNSTPGPYWEAQPFNTTWYFATKDFNLINESPKMILLVIKCFTTFGKSPKHAKHTGQLLSGAPTVTELCLKYSNQF